MQWWVIALIAVIVFTVLLSYVFYRIAFYSPKKRKANDYDLPDKPHYNAARDYMCSLIKELEDIPFEEVTVTSFDGTLLYGRYYHVADGAPLQIQFHGYRSTAFRDFCGGNKLAREAGQNTLLVDQRAHGKSGGNTICFGVRERLDCKAWVDYAVKRFGNNVNIFLAGVSMGAATVLMASDLDLPKNVRGIIADCPYSDPKDIIRKVCKEDMRLPTFLCAFAWLGAWMFGKGLRLSKSSAVGSVKNSEIPVLLVHGEADGFVPVEMSRLISDAGADNITFESFPGADHGFSFIADSERYKKALNEFIHKNIAK